MKTIRLYVIPNRLARGAWFLLDILCLTLSVVSLVSLWSAIQTRSRNIETVFKNANEQADLEETLPDVFASVIAVCRASDPILNFTYANTALVFGWLTFLGFKMLYAHFAISGKGVRYNYLTFLGPRGVDAKDLLFCYTPSGKEASTVAILGAKGLIAYCSDAVLTQVESVASISTIVGRAPSSSTNAGQQQVNDSTTEPS